MKNIKKFSITIITVIMVISACVFTSSAAVPFTDVKSDAWYADAVEYCYTNGYVSGTTPTKFSPLATLTRAQFVTLLANIEDADLSIYSHVDSGFADVKPDHWFHNAVTWAAKEGYVAGVSATKFDPNGKITREQLARILYVYTDTKGYDVLARARLYGYTDAGKISSWAYDEVQWAVAMGLISGVTPTTVVPRGNATRAQAARIIMLYTRLELTEKNAFNEFVATLAPIEINPVSGMPLDGCYGYTDEDIEFTYFQGSRYLYFAYGDMYGYLYNGKLKTEPADMVWDALNAKAYELCGFEFTDVIADMPVKAIDDMSDYEKLISTLEPTGQSYNTLFVGETLFDSDDESYEDAEGEHRRWYYDRLTVRYTPADDELTLWYSVDSYDALGTSYISRSEGISIDVEENGCSFYGSYSYRSNAGIIEYYDLQFATAEDYSVYNCQGMTEAEAQARAEDFVPKALEKIRAALGYNIQLF